MAAGADLSNPRTAAGLVGVAFFLGMVCSSPVVDLDKIFKIVTIIALLVCAMYFVAPTAFGITAPINTGHQPQPNTRDSDERINRNDTVGPNKRELPSYSRDWDRDERWCDEPVQFELEDEDQSTEEDEEDDDDDDDDCRGRGHCYDRDLVLGAMALQQQQDEIRRKSEELQQKDARIRQLEARERDAQKARERDAQKKKEVQQSKLRSWIYVKYGPHVHGMYSNSAYGVFRPSESMPGTWKEHQWFTSTGSIRDGTFAFTRDHGWWQLRTMEIGKLVAQAGYRGGETPVEAPEGWNSAVVKELKYCRR